MLISFQLLSLSYLHCLESSVDLCCLLLPFPIASIQFEFSSCNSITPLFLPLFIFMLHLTESAQILPFSYCSPLPFWFFINFPPVRWILLSLLLFIPSALIHASHFTVCCSGPACVCVVWGGCLMVIH